MLSSSPSPPPAADTDPREVARFERMAESWWSADGEQAALHLMTPARLDFLLAQLFGQFGLDRSSRRPLEELRILDAGCGGGLISEPLARLGASVTGIDPSGACIDAARRHADASYLDIDYRVATPGDLPQEEPPFHAIVCMDVLEHVPDPGLLLRDCAKLLAEKGLLVASTLNRTRRSYWLAIAAAERILRWVPKGTHDWNRFLRPEKLRRLMQDAKLRPVDSAGLVYSPLRHAWRLSETDVSINYAMAAIRMTNEA